MPRSFLYGLHGSRKYWFAPLFAICVVAALYAASPARTQEAPKEQKQGSQASPQAPQTSPQAADLPAYSPEQIQAGQAMFAGQCAFCHGRDAGGGEGGPDLTASALVAQDVHGEKIDQVVRNGRPDKGMPAFAPTEEQLAALIAFIHD